MICENRQSANAAGWAILEMGYAFPADISHANALIIGIFLGILPGETTTGDTKKRRGWPNDPPPTLPILPTLERRHVQIRGLEVLQQRVRPVGHLFAVFISISYLDARTEKKTERGSHHAQLEKKEGLIWPESNFQTDTPSCCTTQKEGIAMPA